MTRTRQQAQAHKRSAASHEPPIALDPAALAVWNQTLSAVTAGHFALADLRMLATYCRSVSVLDTLHGQIADDPAGDLQALRMYKDLAAAVTSAAGKLRLTPASRGPRKRDAEDPLDTDPRMAGLRRDGFFTGGDA